MEDLLARVRARAASAKPTESNPEREASYPCVVPKNIAKAEKTIGYSLPPLLIRLFSEVGNGGFGPDYGLLGIDGGAGNESGHDALALYRNFCKPNKKDRHWRWPTNLLPLVHCGCAMYLCVDCASPEGKIVWFEPNSHTTGQSWDACFISLNCDLQQLMEGWLKEESWLDCVPQMEDGL